MGCEADIQLDILIEESKIAANRKTLKATDNGLNLEGNLATPGMLCPSR
jgi:dihydroorotase-like cyclic amidohydrolase